MNLIHILECKLQLLGQQTLQSTLRGTYRGAKEVTMIIREPSLSDSVKSTAKPDVENRLKKGQ